MNVYRKLQEARIKLQNTALKKSGKNKFAGYEYFELGDFLPAIQNICEEHGLCGVISYTHEEATLRIYDVDDPLSNITFESPMSSASLKGCHDVQNLGAVQTYLRRYLWTNAFEIVEHDALDMANNPAETEKAKPALAVVPKEPVKKEVMIGEAGAEAVIPLSKGGMGGINVVVNVQGSVVQEQDLAISVRYQIAILMRRRGLNPSILGV